MTRVLRHPLLHFIVLGALLQALFALRAPEQQPIEVDAATLATLRHNWQRETGRAPNAAEWQASVHRHADEERLLREALRLGYDERDPVVRERLLRNLAFVFPDRELRPAQALKLARQLGMAERDLVARRRLLQLAEARLIGETVASDVAPGSSSSDRIELRAIQQLWFEGVDAEASALAALAELGRGGRVLGDPFLLGMHFAPQDEAQFARRFGAAFAREVMQAPPHVWIGPIASAYGLHLLRVQTVQAVAAPAVHPYRVLAEREDAALRAGLSRLRARYPLHVGPTGS